MGTAVVTGAASGIGRALVRQLAGEGHLVHLADVSPTEELAAETGGIPARVDVTEPEQMERLAEEARDADLVCLNAGVVGASLGPPWEVPPDEWRQLLDVNVSGIANGLRAFVPRLLDSGQPAHILITASLAGLLTFPAGGAYAATKHAVVALAEQTALALQGTNVSVTLLCPALVRTAMSDTGEDPSDVAADALAAVRSGRFLVMPEEWKAALRDRTERLAAGDPPRLPAPEEASAGSAVTVVDDRARPSRVKQMRLVVEASDYDDAVRFYRDVLGASTELQIHGDGGERVTILDVGRATLELSSPEQVEMIDRVEVGRRVSPPLRVAFEVDEADAVAHDLVDAGAELVAPPTHTPWASLNARLAAPGGLHVTVFQELQAPNR